MKSSSPLSAANPIASKVIRLVYSNRIYCPYFLDKCMYVHICFFFEHELSTFTLLDIIIVLCYSEFITMADYPVVRVPQVHIWPFLMPCLSSFALLTDTKSK